MSRNIGFGGALLLIALGAVLAFGVTVDPDGVNLNTIGLILMGVGGFGVILTLIAMNTPDRQERVEHVSKDLDVDSHRH